RRLLLQLRRSKEITKINQTTVTSWTPAEVAFSFTLEEEKDEDWTKRWSFDSPLKAS
ncbi:Hypothetical predicted protein, partial [Olea europaea subsp. europaea]